MGVGDPAQKAPLMTTDDESSSREARRPRMPWPIWIALGVAAILAIASLMDITQSDGVQMLSPGEKAGSHAASAL
jgi:hypothetical protein